MANTTIDYTKAAQDKTLELIKESQALIVDAVASWAKAAEKNAPTLPTLPALDVPKPEELVKASFDFYGEVLASQRKFANDLLTAAAPVVKVAKQAA
jgi:hypothetical protein